MNLGTQLLRQLLAERDAAHPHVLFLRHQVHVRARHALDQQIACRPWSGGLTQLQALRSRCQFGLTRSSAVARAVPLGLTDAINDQVSSML